jgi:hypothetical protein
LLLLDFLLVFSHNPLGLLSSILLFLLEKAEGGLVAADSLARNAQPSFRIYE